MPTIDFRFGGQIQQVSVPKDNLLSILQINDAPLPLPAEEAVRQALNNPIASPRLSKLVHPGEKIAIVTSDITRPMPTHIVMPPLLEELYSGGIRPEDITLVFALGIHRGHTEAERRSLAGSKTWNEIRCVDSNPGDCVLMGTTSAGTPVEVTRAVAQADRKICIGNIEYHYFAGYSGGVKAIMPGVSTRAAIQSNHRMMVQCNACIGELDHNPVRQDIEEAGRICGVDFILNVVLGEHREILCAVAGHPVSAHRAGCRFLDSLYLKPIPQAADLVLVSAGGTPKDLNLYQAQKALDNAAMAVKRGGIIVLIASCREGFGEPVFEEWMTTALSPQSLVERIRRSFCLGGHKAAAIARVLEKADVFLVSDMEESVVRSVFFTPQPSAQAALDKALQKIGPNASVLAIPCGGSVLPKISR